MTASEILENIKSAGGEILAVGTQLRLLLPSHLLTPDLLSSAKERKNELLALISGAAPSVHAPSLNWLQDALEVCKARAPGCFLCLWILKSVSHGQLQPTGRPDGTGADQFPVSSQLLHLRLECGGPVVRQGDGAHERGKLHIGKDDA